jgi:hypothetical protein
MGRYQRAGQTPLMHALSPSSPKGRPAGRKPHDDSSGISLPADSHAVAVNNKPSRVVALVPPIGG